MGDSRLNNDSLRQRLAIDLEAAFPKLLAGCHYTVAGRVLAALGLDDIDAAEKRASEAIAKYSGMHTGFTRPAASVALEAALMPYTAADKEMARQPSPAPRPVQQEVDSDGRFSE